MTQLIDSFGRVATDLRISVTDRCNLRCTYCMPEEGLDWAPVDKVLSFDEIERVVRVAMSVGVKTVRLTGGEPLVRAHLYELVGRLRQLGIEDLSMTTNGVLLERNAQRLFDAGLQRVNVSLDSLDKHRFALMTRRDQMDDVLRGIAAAVAVGMTPVKINCVILKGVNDHEVLEFADLARNTGVHVRFIEFLPLDADHAWTPEDVVSSADLLRSIDGEHKLVADKVDGPQPATTYRFADGIGGTVGVIPSVSEPFCGSCDRIRMTADGQLRTCLFSTSETDLRAIIRNDGTDDDLRGALTGAVAVKQAGHGIGTNAFIRPKRSMSMIGG